MKGNRSRGRETRYKPITRRRRPRRLALEKEPPERKKNGVSEARKGTRRKGEGRCKDEGRSDRSTTEDGEGKKKRRRTESRKGGSRSGRTVVAARNKTCNVTNLLSAQPFPSFLLATKPSYDFYTSEGTRGVTREVSVF